MSEPRSQRDSNSEPDADLSVETTDPIPPDRLREGLRLLVNWALRRARNPADEDAERPAELP
jgi:hypothetical protein